MGGTRGAAARTDLARRNQVLVEPGWLEDHLDDPNLRVVEVDVSPAAFNEWHIEGAVLWNIYSDLKDADYRPVDRLSIERLLARSGVTPDSTVVFYGYAPAMGLWLMRLFGHVDARILDCSRDTWRVEGRPWTNVASAPPTTYYPLVNEDHRIRANVSEVASAIGDASRTIVDVRSGPEFRGEQFWPSGGSEEGGRSGHIPSALHLAVDDLCDERGSFRPTPELRRRFAVVDASGDADELICYCTIGGRASTAWLVLSELLGRPGVRVYDGSWAEWGKLPSTPVTCLAGPDSLPIPIP